MKIELNGKALIEILALSVGIASANFVSLVDSEGTGGIRVINETIVDTTPVGTIAMWATNTPSDGWIEMDGQSTVSYIARTGDETRGRNISLMYVIKTEKQLF